MCWETQASRQIAQGHFLFLCSLETGKPFLLGITKDGLSQRRKTDKKEVQNTSYSAAKAERGKKLVPMLLDAVAII